MHTHCRDNTLPFQPLLSCHHSTFLLQAAQLLLTTLAMFGEHSLHGYKEKPQAGDTHTHTHRLQ